MILYIAVRIARGDWMPVHIINTPPIETTFPRFPLGIFKVMKRFGVGLHSDVAVLEVGSTRVLNIRLLGTRSCIRAKPRRKAFCWTSDNRLGSSSCV